MIILPTRKRISRRIAIAYEKLRNVNNMTIQQVEAVMRYIHSETLKLKSHGIEEKDPIEVFTDEEEDYDKDFVEEEINREA